MRLDGPVLLLSIPILNACAVDSHCSRTATCPPVDAGASDARVARDTKSPAAESEGDPNAAAGRDGGPPNATDDPALVDPDGNPHQGTADAGPGSAADDADSAVQAPVGDSPIVVVGLPGSDGGLAPDAGRTETSGDHGGGCDPGNARPCVGALGACADGVEVCDESGRFGACSVQPQLVDSCDELGNDADCNGVPNEGCGSPNDNDCGGQLDDTEDGRCQCTPGDTRPCDVHAGLDGVGPCRAGVSECVLAEDGTHAEWGACVGAVGPLAADRCDVIGDDSNCNGIPNHGCDLTPPSVTSSLPTNGQSGVAAEQQFVIAFSEAMDRELTEQAIGFSWDARPTFQWNAASTVLTVVPTVRPEYAAGSFENLGSLAPKTYSFTVGSSANDSTGNGLLAPLHVEFTTLRRVEHALPLAGPDGAYTVVWITNSALPWVCQADRSPTGYQSTYSLTVASFDISALPSGVVAFERASLVAHQAETYGDPLEFVGPVRLEHIDTPSGVDGGNATSTVDAAALRQLGILTDTVDTGFRSVDVTPALAEDYQLRMQRAEQSAYRILTSQVDEAPDEPQYFSFTCSAFRIDATYLLP